jgi:hypothetical protein
VPANGVKTPFSGTPLSEGKSLKTLYISFKRCLLTALSLKIRDNTVRRFYRLLYIHFFYLVICFGLFNESFPGVLFSEIPQDL